MKQTAKPIFIIGAPRSGTSITTWALGQHPNIQPMPETAWIASMVAGTYMSHVKGSERGKFSHLSNVKFPVSDFMEHFGLAANAVVNQAFELRCQDLYGEAYRETGLRIPTNPANKNRHMQLRRSLDDPKLRWVDGTPLNSQFIWGLKQMFPDAQFLHLLRRPEDVAASLLKFDKAGGIPQSAKAAIETWRSHTHNAWLATQAFSTEAVLTVHFETLISETEASYRTIFEFLGEQYSADSLLPYSERINSSKVDDERAKLVEQIISHPSFADAAALHTAITDNQFTDTQPAADEKLRSAFTEYCRSRPII